MTDAGESSGALAASFDLETYIARYKLGSETRLQRLLLIGQHGEPATSKLAYEMAERHMIETGNVLAYKRVFGPDRPPEHARSTHIAYNKKWVDQADSLSHSNLDTLQGRLSSAQSHLNKEAIRAAYLALGEYYRKHGDLREALKAVLRARDYCTSRGQTSHVCLIIIEMAIDLRDYARVRDYVAKAENTNMDGDVTFPSKQRAASGLVYLAEARYNDAANAFTSIASIEDFNSVVSTEDVALYGALLGLATFDRPRLCRLLEGSFSASLELVPNVRDAVRHFCRAEYKACMGMLQQLKPQLLLDIHLGHCVVTLLDMIRDKCLVEYLRPYQRVGLDNMAKDFGLTMGELQVILPHLIRTGQVTNARINCRTQTLTREGNLKEQQEEYEARQNVAQLSEQVLNEAHSMIIRLACVEHNLVVQSEKREGRHYWNPRSDGAYDDSYEVDLSSDDGDTPMVDMSAVNPEDLY